jgi:hypothetical protein
VPASPLPANQPPAEPSGPKYSVRLALVCERGYAPGQVLDAVPGLRSVIDDHSAGTAGADKLTVGFVLRAPTPADAMRRAGIAAARVAEVLTDHATAVDPHGVALVVRAGDGDGSCGVRSAWARRTQRSGPGARGRAPGPDADPYGVVVESVNVSVLP